MPRFLSPGPTLKERNAGPRRHKLQTRVQEAQSNIAIYGAPKGPGYSGTKRVPEIASSSPMTSKRPTSDRELLPLVQPFAEAL
eukprot:3650224-Pyramimonas_sp.AAC.1